MENRTSLLIRCSQQEAEMIRRAARLERRTISGFILNAVSSRLQALHRSLEETPPGKAEKKPEAG